MKYKLKHNINATLLIVIMCIIVMATVLGNYFQYTDQLNNKLLSLAESDLSNRSQTAVQNINTQLSTTISKLENLSLPLTTGKMNNDEFKEMLKEQSNKNDLGTLEFFTADYINQHNESPEIAELLSNTYSIFPSRQNNNSKISVYISIILSNKDRTTGVLRCSYTAKEAYNLFVKSYTRGHGNSFIITSAGTVLIDSSAGNYLDYLKSAKFYKGYSLSQLKQGLLAEKGGVLHYKQNDEEYFSQYTPLGFNNLYVYTTLPASSVEYLSNNFLYLANSLFYNITLIIIIFIVIILVIQIINNRKFKKSQEKLVLEKERYQNVLNQSQAALWEYNILNDTMTQSDPDLGIYMGLSKVTKYQATMLENEIVHPEDINIFLKFCNSLRNGESEISAEFRAMDISGNYVWFELTGSTLFDKNGTAISVIGQSTNIHAKKQELETLRDNANRDFLTKLYNRSALISKINECLVSNEDFVMHAFFMIDVDNFKNINDKFGHTFGDAVLMDFSTHLNKNFKDSNILGRLGGDEFVVFLRNIPSIEFAEEQAQKISQVFRKIYTGAKDKHNISGSIGVSIYPLHGKTFETLMEKADIALYHSKNLGKDCYSFYKRELEDSVILPDAGLDHIETLREHEEYSIIDSSIFAATIDILFDAKNKESSINIILSIIGNHYNIDRLLVVEYSDNDSTASVTFEWVSDDSKHIIKDLQDISTDIAYVYDKCKTKPNGVYYMDNICGESFEKTEYSEFFNKLNITGVFQCRLSDGIHNFGFISATLCDSRRIWTKTDIDSLTLLSKIIGSYLLNLRIREKADRIAMRDSLTGAYNVLHFSREADRILHETPDQRYAVISLDINQFKFYNETYGYREGDRILVEFASALDNMTTENEVFARADGDKFIGFLNYNDDFTNRLDELTKQFNSIKKTDTDFYKLSVAIGIYPIDKDDHMSSNIDKANIARKHVKDSHKSAYSFFDESMKSRLKQQKEIEDVMEEALLSNQFIVYYQPKINLQTKEICGAEALVRWNRPGYGIISPNKFIPIFEENGFIIDIDFYVFEQVCTHIRKLLSSGKYVVPVSVNFSRVHLKNRTLPSKLKKYISYYNIPNNLIEIEITESALVDDDGYLLTILNEIHNMGFKLSMDDFGSGLSSLNSLRKLPFDVLKLDKEFFQNSSATKREQVVIKNIVKMAHDLNMEIVSEGVETEEQAEFLSKINCQVAQGFLFSKPMPISEFEEKYLQK